MLSAKKEKRINRHKRVRAKIIGTASRPRLCVFRSSNHIYAQLIDDENKRTLLAASDKKISKPKTVKEKTNNPVANSPESKSFSGKAARAFEVGKNVAKKAIEKKIEKVVFDRGGYKYHGRVKALAEGAREGGLKF